MILVEGCVQTEREAKMWHDRGQSKDTQVGASRHKRIHASWKGVNLSEEFELILTLCESTS